MRILSWNVNSLRVRREQLIRVIENLAPDVLALQEIKMRNEIFSYDFFQELGYFSAANGQLAFNGVCLLSRDPMKNIIYDNPFYPEDSQKRVISATIQGCRIVNLYVPNGQDVSSDKYAYKKLWCEKLISWLREEIRQYEHMIVLGDFNIAPTDQDVYDPAKWEGQVLCTPWERNAFRSLLDLGLQDSFRILHPKKQEYSWWDYRQGSFPKNWGLRIDLILSTYGLNIDSAGILREQRSEITPSDHAPVWANFS